MNDRNDGWLIVKRDLYFRPGCAGYTGVRDEAGRYTHEFAKQYEDEDHQIIHESEAPEFRKATYSDYLIKILTKQRDEARAALEGSVAVPVEPSDGLLKMFGYAPGGYQSRCFSCEQIREGLDKRASSCRDCASSRYARFVGECAAITRQERGAAA